MKEGDADTVYTVGEPHRLRAQWSQSWKDKHYDSLCKFPQGAKLLDIEVATREGVGSELYGDRVSVGKAR